MTTSTGQPSNLPTDRHWATVEADRLPEVIRGQCDRFWQRLTERGFFRLWRMSDRTFYGVDQGGGWTRSAAVSFGGEDDELVVPRFNHYRSLAQAILATAVAERPDFQAQSKADDTQSLMLAPIATGVIKAFWREKGMEQLRQRDVERALLYGLGFMHLRWSPHDGPKVKAQAPTIDPQTGQPGDGYARDQQGAVLHEGDVLPASCSPISVVHEMDSQGRPLEWAMVAHREDAFDLAARYPQFERELRDAIGRPRWPERVWSESPLHDVPPAGDNRITVWCVYHRETSAVPRGRYAIVAADRVLYDGPALMADEIPVYPLIPMTRLDTGEGHSALWDLLNLQELFDAGASNIATGHDAFGVKNIITPAGSGIANEDIRGGLRVLPYDPGPGGEKPEALDIPPVAEVAYRHQEWLEQEMETISGVNSTARGNPDPNVKSGSFAALMDAKATHFQSTVRAAVVKHDEDIAHGYLKLIRAVGGITRVAEIAGRSGSRLKSVSPGELEQVERVIVEEVSPTLTQPGVRWELTQSLLKAGVVQDPQQALRLFTTGKMEPLFRAPEALLDVINAENDLLTDGQLPPVCYIQQPGPLSPPGTPPMPRTVMPSDDHALHVKEHAALLDIATRRDPRKVKVIEKHIADHVSVFLELPPALGALTGQSLSAPQPAPPGEQPPKAGDSSPDKKPEAARAKPGGGPGGPEQPLMPQNPTTGERAPA